jgi:glyoxylate reductase
MKRKVLVCGNLPDHVLNRLKDLFQVEANLEDLPMKREQLLDSIRDKEGLMSMITDMVDEDLLERAPHLKMIANMAVGYNNVDVKAATGRGIPVTNTPGVLTETTADLAFTLVLSVARRVAEGDRMIREGRFQFWAPFLFLGTEVTGKTLGIIGLGRIGKAVAKRASGFDMHILYHNQNRLDPSEEKDLSVEYADIETLLALSDFVSVHVPLSEKTRHLIGETELSLMKPTAFLINTSRGPVVDERALVSALQNKKIAGAGLDVYENEPVLAPGLAELENTLLLPHVGSATLETRTKMAMMATENLIAGLTGRKPPNLVNPEAWK